MSGSADSVLHSRGPVPEGGRLASGIQHRPRKEAKRLLTSAGPHTLFSLTLPGHRHADKGIQGMSGPRRGSILLSELQ